MPVLINYCHASSLPASVAGQCEQLCKPNSEMQGLFNRIASGDGATDSDLDVMVSYCATYPHHFEDDVLEVLGWATVSTWNDRLQLQAFVGEEHRKKGLGFSLIACLTFDMPEVKMPVAVFSDECKRIADRLDLNCEQWERKNNEWCLSTEVKG